MKYFFVTNLIKINFIQNFDGKILNIHPSLLPKYKGLNTHERAIINKDKHFFFFFEKQLGFLFNDFVNQKINIQTMEQIIDASILFSLKFDLITPNFQDINLVDVHQLLDMNNSHKLRTSKSLGFKFSFENK